MEEDSDIMNNHQFQTFLNARSRLKQLLTKKKEEINSLEEQIKKITTAIEHNCEHDWRKEIHWSCGEKDTYKICKICGKVL